MSIVSYHSLLLVCLTLLVLHYFLKLLSSLLFGVTFSYINPLNFAIYDLKFTHRDDTIVDLSISKIKLHVSLFLNPKKYVRVSVSNVVLDLTQFQFPDSDESEATDNKTDEEQLEKKYKQYTEKRFDPKSPISLYTKNKKFQRLTKCLIRYLPHLSFKVVNTNIKATSNLSVVFEKITGKCDIHKSNSKTSFLKEGNLDNYVALSSIEFDKAYMHNSTTDNILSKFFDQCAVSLEIEINSHSGEILHFEPVFGISDIDVSMLYIFKLINSLNPNFKVGDTEASQNESTLHIPKYQLYFIGCLYRLMKKAKITMQSLKITEIPITNKDVINKFLLSQDDISLDGVLFSSISIDSISLNTAIINPNQVGFSLKFVEDSFPLQWTISLGNFKLSLDYSKLSKYSGNTKVFDIISIPNLLLTLESTVMINILRVIFNNYKQSNFEDKQTITTFQLTVTNPTVDISTEQLAFLLKVFHELNEKKQQIREELDTENESIPPSKDENEKLWKRYKNIIMETLPKIRSKVLVEQPTFLLKSENDTTSTNDMHLLVFKPSLVGLSLDAESIERSLNLKVTANIPDFAIMYQRNNLNNTASSIATLKELNFHTSLKLLELDNFKSNISVAKLKLDLTNLMALNGASIVINMLRLYMLKLKAPSKQIREPYKHRKQNLNTMFEHLPSWFSSFVIRITSVSVKLGAKSIFIKVEDLLNEEDDLNKFISGKPYTPSSVTLSFKKLTFQILSNNEKHVPDGHSTYTTDSSRSLDEFYWKSNISVVDLDVTTNTYDPIQETDVCAKIVYIPTLNTNIYCLLENIYEVAFNVNSIEVDHSTTSHFTVFSSISLLSNVLSYHKHRLFPDIDNSGSLDKRSNLESEVQEDSKKFTLVHWKWFIKETKLKMLMPDDFHFRLDLFDLKGVCANNNVIMKKKLIRLAVKKNKQFEFYNRMLSIESLNLVVKLPTLKHPVPRIYIKDKYINISVPSNFVVHSLFEAIILTIKLSKKFVSTIKTGLSTTKDKIKSSGVIDLPKINLRSSSLSFVLDDDPFEAELGMIYQLGYIENKNRMEKQRRFDEILDTAKVDVLEHITDIDTRNKAEEYLDHLDSFISSEEIIVDDEKVQFILRDLFKSLHKIRVNMSKSWVKTVNEFKLKRRNIVEQNMEFLSNKLVLKNLVSTNFNADMINFNDLPPLMSLLFDDVHALISPPKFENDSNDPKCFLQRVGKGVPLETEWDKIVPMQMTLRASEVRMHLRDFPLPMVYIPNSFANESYSNSFCLKATLVIAEQLPQSDKEYWYLYIPMFRGMKEGESLDKHNSYMAPKTVTTVKTYYEMDCEINTDKPTTVTWSVGYQPVLRQLNACFDTFSKVTRDVSPKLGVWDKLRNIMHGYAKINWTNKDSEVMINILSSTDPYKILGYSSGFSLSFKENINWLINDPDRELERDYFVFKSNSITFGVPDHLSQTLPCWCSKDLIFFPGQKNAKVLTSLYGYYLNVDAYYNHDDLADSEVIRNPKKFKTKNICLDGELELKLSMTFQRKTSDGKISEEFKPHYENVLVCPEYVDDEDFDSFDGFRSNFIHMALNLNAKHSVENTLRISPKSMFQFIKWFKLFSNDLSLPIRNGTLWGAKTDSVDMGSHLKTFKFKFDVEPLFIYHGYRVDISKPDTKTSIGLKARIGSFKCDLHERKEQMVEHVEFLDKNRSIMKMAFYIGKVEIKNIDLRIIGLKFSDAVNQNEPTHQFESFDNDESWISLDDFEELDMKSITECDSKGQIFPVLFASEFTYWMNKKLTKNKFGNEDSHDCIIDSKEFPESPFNHIFDVDKLKMKWYCNVRNLFFEYLAEFSFRAAYAYGTSFKSRADTIKKLENESKDSTHSILSESSTKKIEEKSTKDEEKSPRFGFQVNSVDDFKDAMREAKENIGKVVPVDDFLIRLNDVQVQFMVDPTSDNLILFRTKHNEIEIVTLRDDEWYRKVKASEHAQRVGTVFEEADLLAISKKEYTSLNKTTPHYGSETAWPAFLDGDEPDEFVRQRTILSDVLIYFIFEKASSTYNGTKARNKLYLNIPKFKTRIDSETYLSFFKIVQKVMIYTSPQQKAFAEMIQAVAMATDEKDNRLMVDKLEEIFNENVALEELYESLSSQRFIAEDGLEIDKFIHKQQSQVYLNSVLLTQLINLNLNPENNEEDDNCFMEWVITANKIDVELTHEGESFMALQVEDAVFTRLEMLDKSSINDVAVRDIRLLNNDRDILFPETLTSYIDKNSKLAPSTKKTLLKCTWELGERQDGVANIQNIHINCAPMKISLEDKTGLKLVDFFFPDELKNRNKDSSSSDSEFYDTDEDDDDDDEYTDGYNDSNISDGSYYNRSQVSKITPLESLSAPGSNKTIPEVKIATTEITTSSGIPTPPRSSNFFKKVVSSDSEESSPDARPLTKVRSISSTGTQSSKVVRKMSSTYSTQLNKKIVGGKLTDTNGAIENLMNLGINTSKIDGDVNAEHLKKMSEKANKYFIIKQLCMEDMILNITFSGKGKFRLINVDNLILKVPKYVVKDKLWTSYDILNSVKKYIIKTLLKQTGKLLKNKLFVFKRHKRLNRAKRI